MGDQPIKTTPWLDWLARLTPGIARQALSSDFSRSKSLDRGPERPSRIDFVRSRGSPDPRKSHSHVDENANSKNPAFALGKAPEPLLDSLWTAPGRSGGYVGPPLGAVGAPRAALKAFWGTPDELFDAILALLECTWDCPRAPDPSWH